MQNPGHVLLSSLALTLALATGFVSAQERSFEKLDEPPSPVVTGNDEQGSAWTVARNGFIENSGNKLINQGQVLKVNGADFMTDEAMKAADAPRWALRRRMGEVEVTRDIFYDAARGGLRYVDIFANRGKTEEQIEVEYYNSYRYPWSQIYTSQGREFDERLGARDTGFYIKMPEDREHQGVLYLLSGERSSHKPGIVFEENNQFRVRFTLTVPTGEARALAYWVVQRRLTEPAEIKEVTSEFYRQRLLTDAEISRNMRDIIVNFDLDTNGAEEVEPVNPGLLVALNELAERAGVIRTGQDLLWVAPESQLSGDLAGEGVTAESRFGQVNASLPEVAAIQGGGGRGRQQKLYLRDGTVIPTELAVDKLGLEGSDGWNLELDVSQVEYLFCRISKLDGKIAPGVDTFLRLHSGDVCGITAGDGIELKFMAPWGGFSVPMTEIESMSYLKNPSPRYRLRFQDGSRITAFLVNAPLTLDAMRFGEVKLSASEISDLWSAKGDAPEMIDEVEEIEDLGEFEFPVCLLKGQNLVAGRLADETLHVVSGTTVTTLKPSEIVAITRSYEEDSELLPVFEIELKGGDLLIGTLREDAVQIEAEHVTWSVPVPHFLGMQTPPSKES